MSTRALRAAKRQAMKTDDDESPSKRLKVDNAPTSPCPSLASDTVTPSKSHQTFGSVVDEDVSELEAERQAIMAQNSAYLEQLGLQDVKAKLQIVSGPIAKKMTAVKGLPPRKRSTPYASDEPPRRSGRLSGAKPSGFYIDSETASSIQFMGPDGIVDNVKSSGMITQEREPRSTREIPEVLTLESTNTTDKHGAAFLESLRKLSTEAGDSAPVSESVMAFATKISRLSIDAHETIARVVPERVYSCVFHPSGSKLLVTAGDKQGNVGFWNVDAGDEEENVHLYNPHSSVVAALQYAPGDNTKMYSWSYDGTVRCMDVVKQEFTRMFAISEDAHGWMQHGFISEGCPNTMYACTSEGKVMCVDLRQCGPGKTATSQWMLQAHQKKCNTVHPCPSAPHLLATGGLDGAVKVWDVRQTPKDATPIKTFADRRSVNSAFFNATGTHLLSVTMNNTICLYEESSWAKGGEDTGSHSKVLHHDNQTGRWLATLHGVWNPREPHAFLVGSMQQPRCMEVYSTDGGGRRIGVLRGDLLASVCSRNCWHPNLDVVCGANSSGKLHIFK